MQLLDHVPAHIIGVHQIWDVDSHLHGSSTNWLAVNVMGGHDGQSWLSSINQYDPAKKEWIIMASIVLFTGTHSLCAVSL